MKRGSKRNRNFDRYMGIPLILAWSIFRFRKKMPAKAKRLGIICSAALGDTLLVSGAIADLRIHFPYTELIFFYTPQNAASAMLIPGLDKLVLYHLTNPLKAVQTIRSENVEVMIDFSPWQRLTAVICSLSGAKFTAGFRTSGQHRHFAYDAVAKHRSDLHESENYRELLRSLGIDAGSHAAIVPPSAELPLYLKGRNMIVFHLWPSGAKSWIREWPMDYWSSLAGKLGESVPNPLFVLTGAPSDQPRSEHAVRHLQENGHAATSFVGLDGFATLCKVLIEAQLVVSTNTGVMHLAAILGAATVSINGPTNNGRWGPVGPCAVGVQAPGTDCGFLNLGFEFDGKPLDCMARTTVDQVFEAALQVMLLKKAYDHMSS